MAVNDKKNRRVSLNIPIEYYDLLMERVAERKCSLTVIMNEAIREYLEKGTPKYNDLGIELRKYLFSPDGIKLMEDLWIDRFDDRLESKINDKLKKLHEIILK
jgi:hypothetical protein